MHWWFPLAVYLATWLAPQAVAETITSPSQLNSLTYDYIIVGAGTAGLTLASRLTEDATVSVLVIEAGPSDEGILDIQTPFLSTTLTNTIADWNYSVVSQAGLNNRVFSFPRGRVLGGCSSIDHMFHQYGDREDWDRMASVVGDNGWSWANMKEFVPKHEKIVPPADGHDTKGQINPFVGVHGVNGTVPISLPGFNQTIDSRVIETTRQLAEFPYNNDMGGGEVPLLGIGFLQAAIGGGSRSSSSTTYLQNATTRPNLTVLINTTVMKLLQTNATNPIFKAFRSVQITPSIPDAAFFPSNPPKNVPTTLVTASKYVILSAGSVGTPRLLQLSGIGNRTDLMALGITPIIDNPSVGSNLADHLFLSNVYTVNSSMTQDLLFRNTAVKNRDIATWQTNKTGIIANTLSNNLGFFRFPTNSNILQDFPDPSAGPNAPHWEIMFMNFWFSPGVPQPNNGSFMSIPTVLLSPVSRGNVKIQSSNPFVHPVIDPNFLTASYDIAAMREAVKAVMRFAAAPAWSDFITGPFEQQFISATTDSTIDAYVSEFATGMFHASGTASMSAASVSTGVVQTNLTVKGTEGLLVVDASVFPFPLSAHPQGGVYIFAERAAMVIKQLRF